MRTTVTIGGSDLQIENAVMEKKDALWMAQEAIGVTHIAVAYSYTSEEWISYDEFEDEDDSDAGEWGATSNKACMFILGDDGHDFDWSLIDTLPSLYIEREYYKSGELVIDKKVIPLVNTSNQSICVRYGLESVYV